jgi:hypothetical protein
MILGKVVSVVSAAYLKMTSSSLLVNQTAPVRHYGKHNFVYPALLRTARSTEVKVRLFPSSLSSFSYILSTPLKVQNAMWALAWTRMPT